MLLRWAGSKKRVLEAYHALDVFPLSHEAKFYEPMCGAATLAFHWNARWKGGVVLGDNNPRLMQTYETLRNLGSSLEIALQVGIWAKAYELADFEGKRQMYLKLKQELNSDGPDMGHNLIWAAARFLLINHTSFNGLWRESKAGGYNVPFGGRVKVPATLTKDISVVSNLLKGAELRRGLYWETAADAKEGDLIYLDPPYFDTFSHYGSDGFNLEAHTNLSTWAKQKVESGVTVICSNSDCEEMRDLWEWANVREVTSRSSISCKVHDREDRKELLFVARPPC